VHRFVREVESAAYALLAGRLDLYLDDDARDLHEREPLDPADLRRSVLPRHLLALLQPEDFQGARAFTAEACTTRRARLYAHAHASGLLLPGARGAAQCDEDLTAIEGCLRNLASCAGGAPLFTGAPLHTTVGPLALQAPAPHAFTQGSSVTFAWFSPGTVYASRNLELWVCVLVAASEGFPIHEGLVIAPDETLRIRAPSSREARELLERLAEAHARSLAGPVLRFPVMSFALAEAAAKARRKAPALALEPESLLEKALGGWPYATRGRGALNDTCTAELFGHLTEDDLRARADELLAHAEEVWRPVLEAIAKSTGEEDEEAR
jgi:hypothetical protein